MIDWPTIIRPLTERWPHKVVAKHLRCDYRTVTAILVGHRTELELGLALRLLTLYERVTGESALVDVVAQADAEMAAAMETMQRRKYKRRKVRACA